MPKTTSKAARKVVSSQNNMSQPPKKKPRTVTTVPSRSNELNKMLESAMFSDYTIKCRDREFKVHRIILASYGGNFFNNAVAGGMKEANDGMLDLSEDEPEVVSLLVDYLYDKQPELEDMDQEETFVALYVLADKYGVPGLRDHLKGRFEEWAEHLLDTDGDGILKGLLDRLVSPPPHHPAHCYDEMMQAVCNILTEEYRVKDTLELVELSTRETLHKYPRLAAGLATSLESLLQKEESKMGNITAVMCRNDSCRGHGHRWTYKHGPRGGDPIHCIYCGSAAQVTRFT
ncbi:MAG: hypothetical protein Q9162_007545 [Coniocarpon cinnabarinum]